MEVTSYEEEYIKVSPYYLASISLYFYFLQFLLYLFWCDIVWYTEMNKTCIFILNLVPQQYNTFVLEFNLIVTLQTLLSFILFVAAWCISGHSFAFKICH